MTFGKRMVLVVFLMSTVGLAACVVRTHPAHRHGRPAVVHKHHGHGHGHDHKKPKKHKKHKHRDD